MSKLLILLTVSMCLAYCSQNGILVIELTQKRKLDIPLIAMIVMLSLFCGLRTSYNDTYNYNITFLQAPTLSEYLDSDPKLMGTPLFYGIRCYFRHEIINNYHVFNLIVAFFTIASLICFIKKHSESFIFSILLFFTVGLYVDTLGAAKQCIAIAILTYAINALLDKKFIRFYFIVFIAMLFHSYAIFFVILPLFLHKPWTLMTYITVFGVVVILLTFESAITGFLSVAESAGKNIAEEELFDNTGINPLRLAVFAITPMLSFVFQSYLNDSYDIKKNVLINMSILSFLVMSLGIFTAANLFGRCAAYFELGSIILLPWVLREIFDEQTYRFISIIAGICFIGFFAYDNLGFSAAYRAIGLMDFITTLV